MSIYIAYPEIPFDAIQSDSSVSWYEYFEPRNCILGERYLRSRCTGNSADIEFDLGDGNSESVDYIIVARADLLKTAGTTHLQLYRSSDGLGGSYTQDWEDNSLNTATLYGVGSRDYIATDLNLSAYRGWRFNFSGGASGSREFSKVYFGNGFDFEVPPSDVRWNRKPIFTSSFKTDAGGDDLKRIDELLYSVTINWTGVSDDKITEFCNRILRYSHYHKYFLFTKTQHQLLNNERLIHCKLIDADITNNSNIPDYNSVNAVFEEVVG